MPLDPAQDPDRYDGGDPTGPLDPAADPDRFDAARDRLRSPTLPGLLGDGAQEDERDNLQWLLGLVAVVAFLVAVSLAIRFANG